MRRALTVAGSDSGGGAGLQADLKTFAAFDVYGLSAITAVTVQDTVALTRVAALPPEMVAAQIDAVLRDIGADAAKTGMLHDEAIVEAVAEALRRHAVPHLVVDPVLASTSGATLLTEAGTRALRTRLLPLAEVVTPNLAEAEILAARPAGSPAERREAARAIHALGPRAVIVKGGHAGGAEAIDLLFDGGRFVELRAPRIPAGRTHGTGCAFSAALAAGLALGLPLEEAARRAKAYVTEALRGALPFGRGAAPLDHLHPLRRR